MNFHLYFEYDHINTFFLLLLDFIYLSIHPFIHFLSFMRQGMNSKPLLYFLGCFVVVVYLLVCFLLTLLGFVDINHDFKEK